MKHQCGNSHINCIKVASEALHRCLQQQDIWTVFKSDTTLRSHLVWPKDSVDPYKQDGVVFKIPCQWGKVSIRETGRSIHERIKEHDREIWLAHTQTSAVSEHANKFGHYPLWDEVKFINWDPHWYTRRVKETIHIRLHPNNINWDRGIEIPEGWMPTIKQHNSRSVPQRTREQTASIQNNEDWNHQIINNHSEDRNAPITNSHGAAYNETQPIEIIAWRRPAVSGRNVAIHTHVTISWYKRLISYPFKPRWITHSVTIIYF